MNITCKVRVLVDNAECAREVARLRSRVEQSRLVRQEFEMLMESGVGPFVLLPLPSIRRNEVRFRSELSEPYWRILEREAA